MEVILPIPTLLVIPGGTVSLDSFFVLSGFLITSLMLREQARYGSVGALAFYRRRVLRLLPALLVVVFAASVFAYLTNTWVRSEWSTIQSVTFYYSNYLQAASPNQFCANLTPQFSHLWSLSFEEQFYLIWPWVTIALLSIRVRLRTVVIILLSLIAAIGVYRGLAYTGTSSWCSLFHETGTRADSILWGALLAHIWIRGREPKRGVQIAGWIAAAFLLACMPFTDLLGPFLYRGGLDAIDISCAILILAIVEGKWIGRHLFELKPFVALGVVSYAFYLWHLPVFYAVRHFDQHWNDVVRVVVALAVTLLLTTLSWFLLERPLMNLKGRVEKKRHRETGTSEVAERQ
jgi:peptidoglycan/LPS O-acetylase OafA/YrhL